MNDLHDQYSSQQIQVYSKNLINLPASNGAELPGACTSTIVVCLLRKTLHAYSDLEF